MNLATASAIYEIFDVNWIFDPPPTSHPGPLTLYHWVGDRRQRREYLMVDRRGFYRKALLSQQDLCRGGWLRGAARAKARVCVIPGQREET